jgi:hypothetical protein
MPRVSPIISSLNAGELSPRLDGRVDFDKLPKGLRLCSNWLPLIQGPITKRPGTRFVASTKFPAKRSRLVPFVFNALNSFQLEFGDLYIRFFYNHGPVLNLGVPYEVVTPYLEADLPLLKFTQSGDVIYISHPSYAPRKLSRFAATNWTLTTISFTAGPFAPENIGATTVYASAETGVGITLTASTSIFVASMVGTLFKLTQADSNGINVWTAGAGVAVNDVVRYNGNYYLATARGGTLAGNSPPVHTTGTARDGTGTVWVEWQYLHSGSGWARITAVAGTTATADVVSRFPSNTVGVAKATTHWSQAEWTSVRGYPSTVGFYGDRLYWGGATTRPQTIWGSAIGDYENMLATTLDDAALIFTLNSSDVQQIKWLIGDEKGFLVGTSAGEWIVRSSSQNSNITPLTISAVQATAYGSNDIMPIRVGKAVLFTQLSGRKLREMAYTLDSDGFSAPDMTVRADHISITGLTDLAFQTEPDSIVWAPRTDGVLLGFTYDREQQVTAWHRHPLGGFSDAAGTVGAIVEDVASLPTITGDKTELWAIVKRYVNGATVRYVEYLAPVFSYEDLPEDAYFVDCGLTYSGVAVSTLSGLTHLEGQTVAVLANGAVHPTRVVTAGAITLDRTVTKAQVGLPFTATATTERIEAGAGDGSAQGKLKRISRVIMRLYRTLNLKYGPDVNALDERETRSSSDDMGSPPALFSGDADVIWPGDWETDGCMTFVSDTPTPATLQAIMPVMDTSSPR